MERDLVLGYMSIKLTSFLAMYLHGRDEAASPGLVVLCLAGFAAGLWLLARAWSKARALAEPPPATIADVPVVQPLPIRMAGASSGTHGQQGPAASRTLEPV